LSQQAYIKTAEVASFVCGHFIADAPIAPGQSNYYEIPMVETENCTCSDAAVSVFTKVELMNDAFAALNTVLIPVVPVETLDEHHAGWYPHLVPAYDAGTQVSTHLIDYNFTHTIVKLHCHCNHDTRAECRQSSTAHTRALTLFN
jgi:hypothetical protein